MLSVLNATELNLVSYFAPLSAALLEWIVLSDQPTLETAVGFAIILTSFAILKSEELSSLVSVDERMKHRF